MKTYPILNVPVPTIAYCIFHQPKKGKAEEEYEQTMRMLHDRIHQESAEIRKSYQKGLQDVITREAQSTFGQLAQFLTTPIRSDRTEVQRIITEGVQHSFEQAGANAELGVTWSSEGKTCFPPFRKAIERKLEQNGKAYLQDMGFTPDGSSCDIRESVFEIEGGANLDLIEHIVRDRLGIYGAPHGTHLEESAPFTFSAYNLVHASGTRPPQERKNGLVEISLWFSKPAMEYQPFRNSLIAGLEQHLPGNEVLHTSLWQRKLGLGKGREFILRFLCNEVKKLDVIVKWLREGQVPEFPADVLAENSAMLFKELLF